MKGWPPTLAAIVLTMACTAQAWPVTGLWDAVNELTAEIEAQVKIAADHGRIEGVVVSVSTPKAGSTNPLCEACHGDHKNQPIVGMVILHALPSPDLEQARGEILDPENGRVYQCILRTMEDGERLEVRAFFGVPLLGRTQVWRRHE